MAGERELARVMRWERRIRDAVMTAMRNWQKVVKRRVVTETGVDTAAVAATADVWQQQVDRHVMPVFEQMGLERLAERVKNVPPPVSPLDPPDVEMVTGGQSTLAGIVYQFPALRDWQRQHLQTVSNRLARTPDDVMDAVAEQLDQAVAEGEDTRAASNRVQDVLRWTGAIDWPGRAETIARTETTSALNAATLRAAETEQFYTGDQVDKVWQATMDRRTRPSHFAADGQRVRLGESFIVGGWLLAHPGDTSAPPGEVVNCRCAMQIVDTDDPLPGEDDRHTERGEGDATVRNRSGTQADEVARRAADGVTRARDETEGAAMIAAAAETTWQGVLAPLGVKTDDGRRFAPDADIRFRDFPLPLMWQRQSGNGHDQAFTVGAIRGASVEDGHIVAHGVLFDTPEAQEAAQQIRADVTAPSVDFVASQWRMVGPDGETVDEPADADGEPLVMQIEAGKILGATLVATPAFGGTSITLADMPDGDGADEAGPPTEPIPVQDDATPPAPTVVEPDQAERPPETGVVSVERDRVLLAAASEPGAVFDADMFTDPGFTRPTALHMTDSGRVCGHIAAWGSCHVGVADRCATPPRSRTGYAMFHVSEVETEQGPVGVGRLTVGGGHADARLGVQPTIDHYDDVGTSWALVRAGEDEHGIWVSGVPDPSASSERVQAGLSAPVSGDWRRHGGNLELVAALAVVTPGFPVPRGAQDDRGRSASLVAAGVLQPERDGARDMAAVADAAARRAVAQYVDRQRRTERVEAVNAMIVEDRDRRLVRMVRAADRFANMTREH